MKKLLLSAMLVLCTSAFAFAGECDDLFTNIENWLAKDGNLIRVVTTYTTEGNRVAYTRGYLEKDENLNTHYLIPSAHYLNDGPVENPFRPTKSKAPLALFNMGNNSASFNYIVEGEGAASIGFSMTCSKTGLTAVSDASILIVNFRYSSAN